MTSPLKFKLSLTTVSKMVPGHRGKPKDVQDNQVEGYSCPVGNYSFGSHTHTLLR